MRRRAGGPIDSRAVRRRNKAFFFVNYEEFRQPSGVSRDRNILNPLAQQGIFTYIPPGGGAAGRPAGARRANGLTSTADSTRCQPPP